MDSPWIQTASGRRFPLLAPSPEDVAIEDIAHALANVCRFAGHVREFYSVAQHSVLVSYRVPREDALAALLHDAAEAYVGDVTRPLKPLLPGSGGIEVRIMAAILRRFDLPTEIPPSVHAADLQMLATERRDLLTEATDGEPWPCLAGVEPLPELIAPWAPAAAKRMFLYRFYLLKAGHS